jgi:acyl-CoA dehydrogenase
MDFAHSPRSLALQAQLRQFMADLVLPSLPDWHRWSDAGVFPDDLVESLKAQARALGLWNLFLPSLRDDEPGTRLSNLDYAPLAEIMGRVPWAAEVFNCSAPDSGNMELLHRFATPAQVAALAEPAAGRRASVVLRDERARRRVERRDEADHAHPARRRSTGSSTAASGSSPAPRTRAAARGGDGRERRDDNAPERCPRTHAAGADGHAWARGGAQHPGRSSTARSRAIASSCFATCACRLDANLLGEPGAGFALAQARLGPGRVHHCMRSIGQCELALELMCDRALERRPSAAALSASPTCSDWIAESRIEIDQARLLVLRAAWRMDRAGNAAARTDVSAIKLVSRAPADARARPRDAGLRRDGPVARHAAGLPVDLGPRDALARRARTRCTCAPWRAPN